MSGISKLANGIGKIFRTEPDGITLVGTVNNTPEEVALIKQEGASKGPVSGEILATGSVQITSAAAGTINNVDVNGVNQLGAVGVVITVGDEDQTAIDTAAAINLSPPSSGPRYNAQAVADLILLTIEPGFGDSQNGNVVNTIATGASTFVNTDIDGGANGSADVDALSGVRYFINADVSAVEGDLAGSTEITEFIIIKGIQANVPAQALTIAAGTIVPVRKGFYQFIALENEAAAATDDLDFIDTTGFQDGDELCLVADEPTQIFTLRDLSVSGGNIKLLDQQSFSSGGPERNICVVRTTDAGITVWAEKGGRGSTLTGDGLWEAGLPIDFGHRQEEITAGGGTINVNVDLPLDKTHLELVTTGLVVLAGNWSVQFTGGPAKDGQPVEVKYNGTATKGAFSITIFGIALTAQEILVGGVLITAKWDDANSVWEFAKYYDHTKAGLIQTENLNDDAVTEIKILDEAVTNPKIKDDAVSTAKVQDSAITTSKINNSAVTLDKVEAGLKEESEVIAVSFEANAQGAYSYYPAFKCLLTKIRSQVSEDLAPTNAGTIQAANTIGNMANGLITHAAAAAFGDLQTVSPTTNNDADPGGANDHFDFTSAKGNAGGRTNLILTLTRVV